MNNAAKKVYVAKFLYFQQNHSFRAEFRIMTQFGEPHVTTYTCTTGLL